MYSTPLAQVLAALPPTAPVPADAFRRLSSWRFELH